MRLLNQLRWRSTLPVALGLMIVVLGFGGWSEDAKAQQGGTHKKANVKSSPAHRASARGAASAHTRTKSAKRKRYSRRSRRVRGQQAPTTERIAEIQSALAKDGSYAGEPTGKWDSTTVEAMRRFQAGHGLNPTGKLDALTLQKLGLGSSTAGVAPPMLPTTPSEAATQSSSTGNSQPD